MARIVFDASSIVSALLKRGSIPERALLLARSRDTLCLSDAVEAEIDSALRRPKFRRYFTAAQRRRFLDLLTAAAFRIDTTDFVTDCRDPKDNKYLELALAAWAEIIVASDNDLLSHDPWRAIPVITPAAYVARVEAVARTR